MSKEPPQRKSLYSMPDTLPGNMTEARQLADERFLRKIAYLYYEDNHSQETIAAIMYCSRQTVSKALQKARERGIVQISIVPDVRVGYIRNLMRDGRMTLGLEDLILVAGQNVDTMNAQQTADRVVADIAKSAAEYLDHLLTDSDILAVSGGSTLRSIIRYASPSKLLPHMHVVATIGFADQHATDGDANMIAYDLAQTYGAVHNWFPSSAFLQTHEQVQQMRALPLVKDAYEMMLLANVTVLGLWAPETNEEKLQQGFFSSEQWDRINAYHPVADINHWIFDAKGRCINDLLDPPPYFLSGLEIPRLKEKIQQTTHKVILVAGGGPALVPAIRAILNARLINILITDHVTAQLLLMNA
jgi:deoxyribonucleoside regulator